MDHFEKHIREHKSLFDDYQADKEKIWANISSRLESPKPKTIPLWRSFGLRVAAGIILILGIAAFLTLSLLNQERFMETGYGMALELQDIDRHYQNLVFSHVQMVQEHPNLSAGDKEEFLSFMDELDAEYKLLRLELKKNLDNELVLEAIIGNYKKRIELIETLLSRIDTLKQTEEGYGYTL